MTPANTGTETKDKAAMSVVRDLRKSDEDGILKRVTGKQRNE